MWVNLKNNSLKTLNYQHFEASVKINGSSIESYPKRLRLLIEILLEENRPVVTENYVIEYRHKSIKKRRFLGLSRFWCKKSADWNLNRILSAKCKVADCDPHEWNQTCSYGEIPFRYSKWINFNNSFRKFWSIKILMPASISRIFQTNPPWQQ